MDYAAIGAENKLGEIVREVEVSMFPPHELWCQLGQAVFGQPVRGAVVRGRFTVAAGQKRVAIR